MSPSLTQSSATALHTMSIKHLIFYNFPNLQMLIHSLTNSSSAPFRTGAVGICKGSGMMQTIWVNVGRHFWHYWHCTFLLILEVSIWVYTILKVSVPALYCFKRISYQENSFAIKTQNIFKSKIQHMVKLKVLRMKNSPCEYLCKPLSLFEAVVWWLNWRKLPSKTSS